MRHEIPTHSSRTHLANAIENAKDADIIVCRSDAMKVLAERAHKRMCPDKLLTFEVS